MVLHGSCTKLQSHNKGSLFSTSSPAFIFFIFLMTTILTFLRCCVIGVLICIFLMISDVGCLFTDLLAICVRFGGNVSSVPLLDF